MVRDRTRAPGGFPAFRPTCGRAVQNAGRKDPSYLDIHTGHTGVARGDATALVARYGQPQRHRDEVYGFAPLPAGDATVKQHSQRAIPVTPAVTPLRDHRPPVWPL